MKWPTRIGEKNRIMTALQSYSSGVRPLPGIANAPALDTLSMQFVASIRREDYYRIVRVKQVTVDRANPNHARFDAERAVAYHVQSGDIDEAAWLVFLMTHFARPADSGWLRLRDVYGKLGAGVWSWQSVRTNPAAFKAWLAANWTSIRGKFGNHRKYESLRPDASRNMGLVVDSYLHWIGEAGHAEFFRDAVRRAGNDPHRIFDLLYVEMPVVSFGRLAKFDYLSLLGRYGLAPVAAGSAYLQGATGPTRGARLLIDGSPTGATSVPRLEALLIDIDRHLRVGMEVMEDALCNWQKNPTRFIHFRG